MNSDTQRGVLTSNSTSGRGLQYCITAHARASFVGRPLTCRACAPRRYPLASCSARDGKFPAIFNLGLPQPGQNSIQERRRQKQRLPLSGQKGKQTVAALELVISGFLQVSAPSHYLFFLTQKRGIAFCTVQSRLGESCPLTI